MSEDWTRALIRVSDGRGFVVGQNEQLVITAGHCLSALPPCHACSYLSERTFRMLGPIGGEATVLAECLFVDPVSDLAVLGPPDPQVFAEEWQAYIALVEARTSLPIASVPLVSERVALPSGGVASRPPTAEVSAWVPALDGTWFHIDIIVGTRGLTITKADGAIVGGISGSPIVLDGAAIGMICTTGEDLDSGEMMVSPGNVFLAQHLPTWLLNEITCGV